MQFEPGRLEDLEHLIEGRDAFAFAAVEDRVLAAVGRKLLSYSGCRDRLPGSPSATV